MSKILNISIAVVLLAGSVAWADWDPGDDHKMHFPQLPDPQGWDVAFNSPSGLGNGSLADDWECSQTGPVDDIHFWISVQKSPSGTPPPVLAPFRVSIRADAPAGSIAGVDYSTPASGNPLWTMNVDPTDPSYNIRWYGSGLQGWYDPWTGIADPDDHFDFYQINLTNLDTADNPAFQQKKGTIYWLEIGMLPASDGHNIGWKTADLNSYPAPDYTGKHFQDDAVYSPGSNPNTIWQDLYYPNVSPPKSLDLAFVITPEPATLGVLALGGLLMLIRRRKSDRNPFRLARNIPASGADTRIANG